MQYVKRILACGCCLTAVASAVGADRNAPLERQFLELPVNARRLTGPLFWLHGDESRRRLETYLEKVVEGGNGCFTAESRPHSDWLGPDWYRDLSICLEAAKKHDLQMWIFDERWWPSQSVANRVPPEYIAKRLEASAIEVENAKTFEADGYGGPRYVAAVAGRVAADGKVEGDSLVDLAPNIKNGRLTWSPPPGRWRVMKFTHVRAPNLLQGDRKWAAVDGASQDCVDWFLKTVYQPHYDRFGPDFGKTIRGFFYDEPETPGDWGTELHRVLAERNVDWKKAYVAYKFGLTGEEQTAAKFQYLDAFADAWGRTMYGGITRWCRDRGVKSIGHLMEHSNLYLDAEYCAGDVMRLQRYSDMGAIDAVGRQFEIGKRKAYDVPCWQTPKLASSVSHVFGKEDDIAMVEIFGARGQDLTYREMKWWTDHMQVSGVNFIIPHSFNPRAPYDSDCPPYFYNDGFEPRWPLYRVYADYTSRLSLMLAGGRHVCPAALLFGGNVGRVGKMIPPDGMLAALQDAGLDCDLLPFDVFERDAALDGRDIKLHNERYQVLIVPPVEVIPYETLAKAKEFLDRGGVVVGYGFLPSKSATIGKNAADIAALRRGIWGDVEKLSPGTLRHSARHGAACVLPEIPNVEQIDALVAAGLAERGPAIRTLSGRIDGWLHILHRQKEDCGVRRDIFFIANQNHEGAARDFVFRIRAAGEPECWDAMRNEITRPSFERIDTETVDVRLTMEPLEAVLLVFSPEKTPRPRRIEAGVKPIRDGIALTRESNPPQEAPRLDPNRKPATLGPVRAADPFRGRATIPNDVDLARCRVYLEMDDLPDESAAITVNGARAGGLIGRPLRLDVTKHVRPGENVILIEPLAPKTARLVFYEK